MVGALWQEELSRRFVTRTTDRGGGGSTGTTSSHADRVLQISNRPQRSLIGISPAEGRAPSGAPPRT